jgi:hypothetical protein
MNEKIEQRNQNQRLEITSMFLLVAVTRGENYVSVVALRCFSSFLPFFLNKAAVRLPLAGSTIAGREHAFRP